MHPQLKDIRNHFLAVAGRSTQELGLGRILGQVYFLFLFSEHPLCLDDIARELSISKASSSNAVRELGKWKALRHTWIKGDRKDYFVPETDFGKILNNGFLSQITRKVDSATTEIQETQEALKSLKTEIEKKEDANAFRLYQQRLSELRETVETIKFLLGKITF